MNRSYWLYGLFAACLMAASGCAGPSKDWSKKLPWSGEPRIQESKYQTPAKMVVLWSPAMYTAAGKTPTRGFGGRIYFYNAKNETVPVEGQLVVYGFDDTHAANEGPEANQNRADRRFAYTPEQFSTHYAPTELGASYSIWVPWDAVGNPETKISLLPIFTSASGQVVMGQQSLNLLPGPNSPPPDSRFEETVRKTVVNQAGVRAVNYEQPAAGGDSKGALQMDVLSIPLSQNLTKGLAEGGSQNDPTNGAPKLPPEILNEVKPLEWNSAAQDKKSAQHTGRGFYPTRDSQKRWVPQVSPLAP